LESNDIQLNKTKTQYEEALHAAQNQNITLFRENQHLRQALTKLCTQKQKVDTECLSILDNNAALRLELLSATRWYSPDKDDDYYAQRFQSLQSSLQSQIARLVRKSSPLPYDQSQYFDILDILGGVAKESAEFLNRYERFQEMVSRQDLLLSFITHIVGAFIFTRILNPSCFAFGADSVELSKRLKQLEDICFSEGGPDGREMN